MLKRREAQIVRRWRGALKTRKAAGEGGYEFGGAGQQNKNFVDLRGGKMALSRVFPDFRPLEPAVLQVRLLFFCSTI